MSDLVRLDRGGLAPLTSYNRPAQGSGAATAPLAGSSAAADQMRTGMIRGVVPAVEQSLVAVVISPDVSETFADLRPDVLRPIQSWQELPAILQDLREQAAGRKVVLDLAVHGNNGTGLKVVSSGVRGDIASITSIAEVNRMISEAGYAPGEIVILTEGCNVHRSWAISADGFTATERESATAQARQLATKRGLEKAPEIVDRGPTAIDKQYEWRGRGPGTNWISTVLLQYLTNRTEGAPLHDLREYRNRQAPLEGVNAEVKWADARRGEMVSQLQGTRFVPGSQPATGGQPHAKAPTELPSQASSARMRMLDRVNGAVTPSAASAPRQAAPVSPAPTQAPPATRQAAPVSPAPVQAPSVQPGQNATGGMRFIDRLRQNAGQP